MLVGMLNQGTANYGLGATFGPLDFIIRPAELEEIKLIASVLRVVSTESEIPRGGFSHR